LRAEDESRTGLMGGEGRKERRVLTQSKIEKVEDNRKTQTNTQNLGFLIEK